MRSVRTVSAVALAALLALAPPALADAIDGHWCSQDGRRLEITGPSIVTPGGVRITGTYDRHYFSYVAPPADKGAGETVDMALMGEMAVQVRAGNAAPETWNRCAPPVSMLPWPAITQRIGTG